MVVYRAGRKPAWTSRGHAFHDMLARVMRRHVMGGGHVMRCDAECVRDETSGIGPGPSGHRDRVGTRCGMSHNMLGRHLALVASLVLWPPHLWPLLDAWVNIGWVWNHLPVSRIKTASILHFKEHTTYCLRLLTTTGA